MELDEERDEEDPEDVERMAAEPAEGNEPQLVQPCAPGRLGHAAHGEDEAHPDEHLLEARAAPDDRGAGACLKADAVIPHHIGRVAEKGHQPKDDRSDMTRHKLERCRHVDSEPRHHVAVLVTYHREFPEIVRHEKRHHEDEHIEVWLK